MTGTGRKPQADDTELPRSPGPVPAPRSSVAWRLFPVLALAAMVAAIDQGTKIWAVSRLQQRVIVLPGGWVKLRLISNPGAAFSLGGNVTWVFTVSAAAAVIVVPWVAARPGSRSRLQRVALGLLLGGAAGNLIDRLFRAPGFGVGQVIDFIDYHQWFIGNVADIAIVTSAVMFITHTTIASHQRLTRR